MTEAPAKVTGRPLERIEGRLKVTGAARYAAEFDPPGTAHAVLVTSTVGSGRVAALDATAAEGAPGALAVLDHTTIPRLGALPEHLRTKGWPGETRTPLGDDVVHYAGQPVAVVVAETLEQAAHAATLVRVAYEERTPLIDLERAMEAATEPPLFVAVERLNAKRGDAAAGLAGAASSVECTYRTPVECHAPMETPSTTASWDGGDLTVHTTTRGIVFTRQVLAAVLGLEEGRVRVVCPYVGGAFGSKGFLWDHTILAALAARRVGRPVKLVLTRREMFAAHGHRPRTVQTLALGAARDGRLAAIRHATATQCSPIAEFTEPCGRMTRHAYACPNLEVTHRLVRVNTSTPTFMRAPGETPGMFALESAMDELAAELGLDPLELRLRNVPDDVDPDDGKPWSSMHLRECLREGARRFGWAARNPRPGSTRTADGLLVGWGMATAAHSGSRLPASARVALSANGAATVASMTHDAGHGTYTMMAQLAADALGLPVERVRVELGDSRLPDAPVSGGSWTTASVGPAVIAACQAAGRKLIDAAVADPASPLFGLPPAAVSADGGRLFAAADPSRGEAFADVLRRAGLPSVEAEAEAKPGDEKERFSIHSFGAHFVEVNVDPLVGRLSVVRHVGVFDVGRVLNPMSARSQLVGGITFGLGMALMEESAYDGAPTGHGRPVSADLANYHLPVHADIPPVIDVTLVDRPDPHINPMGARGLGEIGIVGVAAAIANAVFHATGKRVRDLPITAEKLL